MTASATSVAGGGASAPASGAALDPSEAPSATHHRPGNRKQPENIGITWGSVRGSSAGGTGPETRLQGRAWHPSERCIGRNGCAIRIEMPAVPAQADPQGPTASQAPSGKAPGSLKSPPLDISRPHSDTHLGDASHRAADGCNCPRRGGSAALVGPTMVGIVPEFFSVERFLWLLLWVLLAHAACSFFCMVFSPLGFRPLIVRRRRMHGVRSF